MATVSADTEGKAPSNLKKGRVTLFPGTPNEKTVETMVHEVNPGGGAKFIATEVSNLGVDDALALRSKAMGGAEFIPIRERVRRKHESGQRVPGIDESGALVRPPAAPTAAPAVAAPGSPEELAEKLRPFKDDPEMQDLIMSRWREKRAAVAAEHLARAEKMVPAPKMTVTAVEAEA